MVKTSGSLVGDSGNRQPSGSGPATASRPSRLSTRTTWVRPGRAYSPSGPCRTGRTTDLLRPRLEATAGPGPARRTGPARDSRSRGGYAASRPRARPGQVTAGAHLDDAVVIIKIPGVPARRPGLRACPVGTDPAGGTAVDGVRAATGPPQPGHTRGAPSRNASSRFRNRRTGCPGVAELPPVRQPRLP